ncbi:MAG: alpha-galactosidase [Candidatus Latescibacterota bacterium]
MAEEMQLKLEMSEGSVWITAPGWPGMKIGPARCRATLNGKKSRTRLHEAREWSGDRLELDWRVGAGVVIAQTIIRETPGRLRWKNRLTNTGSQHVVFNHVDLLTVSGVRGSRFDLGSVPSQVRIMENSAYHGQVRSVGQIMTGLDGRKALDGTHGSFVSDAVTMLYSGHDGQGLLLGFESFDRFQGRISASSRGAEGRMPSGFENVDRGTFGSSRVAWGHPKLRQSDRFTAMSAGFGGANLPVEPKEVVELEDLVMEIGPDPYRLLEDYADRVVEKYEVRDLPKPFANWCSWYPYRLGVTEERVVETARVARERSLDKLGLRFVQVDLGWEKHNIPTYFEENERFPHGLKWLSEQLETWGFELGAWKGFTCVGENHPIARAHRDWLVRDTNGKPKSGGRWFWEPHVEIFHLDITHPAAQQWVREQVTSLAARGVRYLKWDFGGNLTTPGARHDPGIACSEAAEGMRLAGCIVQDAMNSQGEEGLVLDCTASETAHLGCFKMFYTNYDTGNTGLGFHHLRSVYTALGVHLFKNQRWALLQPSCLVVGLPGTLEEARIRATATFLSAGHVDISDDLTTLPEDRWRVLLSVLPPIVTSAKVADLFHPVRISTCGYQALTQGLGVNSQETCEPQGATVWHVPIHADWDEWHLVGLFNFFEPEREASGAEVPMRFEVDFSHIDLNPEKTYWAHEFWSGQFLGTVPLSRKPEGAYRHPGDLTGLVNDSAPGVLNVAFCGPAIKLLVIRRPRLHPWPVGTTFHQSGGLELAHVVWDAARKTLSGELHRPPGQIGSITIAGIKPSEKVVATVEDVTVPTRYGANGSLCVPVITRGGVTRWRVTFGKMED